MAEIGRAEFDNLSLLIRLVWKNRKCKKRQIEGDIRHEELKGFLGSSVVFNINSDDGSASNGSDGSDAENSFCQ